MRHEYYRLDENHVAHPCDMDTWIQQFADPNIRRVAETRIGDFYVSTVFMGNDLGFRDEPPRIFETIVFRRSVWDDDRWRAHSATWEEALAMHERGVAWLREHLA
jgi:hypothetical protein